MTMPARCPECRRPADWDEARCCRHCRIVLRPLAERGMGREDWAAYVGLSVEQLDRLNLKEETR